MHHCNARLRGNRQCYTPASMIYCRYYSDLKTCIRAEQWLILFVAMESDGLWSLCTCVWCHERGRKLSCKHLSRSLHLGQRERFISVYEWMVVAGNPFCTLLQHYVSSVLAPIDGHPPCKPFSTRPFSRLLRSRNFQSNANEGLLPSTCYWICLRNILRQT